MKRLANYLGKELSEEQARGLVEFCSFENMKNGEVYEFKARSGDFAKSVLGVENGRTTTVVEQQENETTSTMKVMRLFRKGEAGDWKNYLSDEMSRRIDDMIAHKLVYHKPFKYLN